MEDDLNNYEIGEDLNILENVRRPQYFGKRKTTTTVWKMEDNLNMLRYARDPQYFVMLKITSTFGKGRAI